MATYNLTINMDAKCAECKTQGTAPNGLCLGCTCKAMGNKPMKTKIGRLVQQRFKDAQKSTHSTEKP